MTKPRAASGPDAVRRTAYLLFVVLTRAFWIAVCLALLTLLFTRIYPMSDGFGRMFVDVIAILLGFSILRLASARPRRARPK